MLLELHDNPYDRFTEILRTIFVHLGKLPQGFTDLFQSSWLPDSVFRRRLFGWLLIA